MRNLLSFAILFGLSGCAVTPEPATPTALEIPPVASASLPGQTLAPGDCGLFIWTADDERRFILFSQSKSMVGVWNEGGKNIALSITEQNGEPAQDQFPVTKYVTEASIKLSVSLQTRQAIIDGTRFKAGTLKITEPEQWERIIPVVGLSVCQSN